MNTSAYETIGTLAQMNPPLRSPHDHEVLWQALRDGVIDFIATDHALTGWAVTTIVGGEIVYDQGKVNTEVRGRPLTFLQQIVANKISDERSLHRNMMY